MTDTGKCPAFGYDCEYVAKVEAQAAEIQRLKREVMLQMGWKTEAQNEVERLREALRDILRGDDPAIPSAIEHIARAALGETE
jgi:hypothetical protein